MTLDIQQELLAKYGKAYTKAIKKLCKYRYVIQKIGDSFFVRRYKSFFGIHYDKTYLHHYDYINSSWYSSKPAKHEGFRTLEGAKLGLEKCLEEYIDIYHDTCVVQEWDIVLNIESDITIEDIERYKSY